MAIQYEPFVGFTLFGIHSSKYNIKRIMDGGRYNKWLTADFENISESVAGQVGLYDFGTKIKEGYHSMRCFCDGITEFELRWVQAWLSPGKVGEFILDEAPYKYYMVKLANRPNLSFVPFGYSGEGILYKGYFDLELIALYPYGLSRFDTLDELIYDDPQGRFFYNSGLLYKEFLPPSTFQNIKNNTNIILYNGGNQPANVNVRITGTWNSLTIRNRTTNQEFTLKKNDIPATFEVDANLGQCRHVELEKLATDYHEGTYLQVEGTGWVDMYPQSSFTKNSNIVSFPIDIHLDEYIEGKFIFIDGGQYEIAERLNDRQVRLVTPFTGATGLYDATIVKANKISILGTNLNISKLEFQYKYTYS